MRKVAILLFLSLVGNLGAEGAIIGEDDRKDYLEVRSPALRAAMRASVVLVDRSMVDHQPSPRWSSRVTTHGAYDNLCPGTRFANQPAPGDCSGALVGRDLVLTAAHCLAPPAGGCETRGFVLDFLVTGKGEMKRGLFPWQVYGCKKIEAIDEKQDWAIVRLDRKVRGRRWLAVSARRSVTVGTKVFLLSFPRGIPAKLSGPEPVVENTFSDPDNFFEALFDSFGGSSGGAVIDPATMEIVGIHTTGFGELVKSTDPLTGKACKRLRTYDDPSEATPTWAVSSTHFADEIAEQLRLN